jgi:hypothetical protein
MPTNRKRISRGSVAHLTLIQKQELFTGFVIPGDEDESFATMEDAQAAWRRFREPLMQEFIAKNPGQRPWAYWEFDQGAESWADILKLAGCKKKEIFTSKDIAYAEMKFLKNHGLIGEKEGITIAARNKQKQILKHEDF